MSKAGAQPATEREQQGKLIVELRAHKKNKDWRSAADCLVLLKGFAGESWDSTELAKILQRAGDFEAAISEINWLLARAATQVNTHGWNQLSQNARERMLQKQLAGIYKAAALICKREKKKDLSENYKQLEQAASAKAEALDAVCNKERETFFKENPDHPLVAATQTVAYKKDRSATALKRAGDWDGAIKALYEVKRRTGYGYSDMKLAKYLQQAGRFDESMQEFQWLLDMAELQCEELFGHNGRDVVMKQLASRRARIYAGMRLCCERENRADLAMRYTRLGEAAVKVCDEFAEKVAAADDVENRAFEQAEKRGGKARLAHLRKYGEIRDRNIQERDRRIRRLKKQLGIQWSAWATTKKLTKHVAVMFRRSSGG